VGQLHIVFFWGNFSQHGKSFLLEIFGPFCFLSEILTSFAGFSGKKKKTLFLLHKIENKSLELCE